MAWVAAVAQVPPLAPERLHAAGVAKKKKKKLAIIIDVKVVSPVHFDSSHCYSNLPPEVLPPTPPLSYGKELLFRALGSL